MQCANIDIWFNKLQNIYIVACNENIKTVLKSILDVRNIHGMQGKRKKR